MRRRRIIRTLGAAAGALLGAAFLPAAIAFADNYEIIPDPYSTETLTGVYGLENTAPPAETGSIQGHQVFEVYDTTTHHAVGYFDADESNSIDLAGDTNTELLVTHDLAGTVGTAAGDTPPVGSVLDTYTYEGDFHIFGYVYSALPATTGGADIASETLTSFGFGETLPKAFDAIAAESEVTAFPPITLAGGDEIVPVPGSAEQFTGVSGGAPWDMDVQGTQEFEVLNTAGTVIGTFDGDVTTTLDGAGTTTEAILVTSDGTGPVGTAAGDIPAVGSIFSILEWEGGDPRVYSDLVSPTGGAHVISATDTNDFGTFNTPTTFDAVAAESDRATIPLDGYNITPTGPETFTAIDGLPPADVAIQGTQEFDVKNASGDVVGTFRADVTTTSTSVYGNTTETLLVTSDGTGTVGTLPGDVPAVGSVIDVDTLGSGYQTVYSDLVSTIGFNAMSDTLVTPFGDFWLPSTFDAAHGLIADPIAMF